MGLFHRLSLLLVPPTVLFLLLLGAFIHQVVKRHQLFQVEKDLNTIAQLHQARIDDYLDSVDRMLYSFNSHEQVKQTLADYPDGRLPHRQSQVLQGFVNQAQSLIDNAEQVYLLTRDFNVAASTQTSANSARFEDETVIEQLKTGSIESDVRVINHSELGLLHAVALKQADNIVGYVVIVDHAAQIARLNQDRSSQGVSTEAYLVTTRKDGRVPFVYLSQLRFDPRSPNELFVKSTHFDDQLTQLAMDNDMEHSHTATDYRGETVIATTRRFTRNDWILIVKRDESEALYPLAQLTTIVLFGACTLAIMALIISAFTARGLSGSLAKMARTASLIRSGDKFQPFEGGKLKELDTMAALFNQMLDRIKHEHEDLRQLAKQRSRELQLKNAELNGTQQKLQQLQNQLMESEKRAMIGGLGCGIVHEIDAPLFKGLVLTNELKEQANESLEKFQANRLSEVEYGLLLKSIDATTSLIAAHLNRTAELVRSFRHIDTEQTCEFNTELHLGEYLQDLFITLSPSLNARAIEYRLAVDPDIRLSLPPGLLTQMITAIVLNSLKHGFENKTRGTILVQAKRQEDWTILTISDDGSGMDSQTGKRLFEPCFGTTQGCFSVCRGLYCVYAIVNQKLKGKIAVATAPDKGTCFTISLPAKVKEYAPV